MYSTGIKEEPVWKKGLAKRSGMGDKCAHSILSPKLEPWQISASTR